MKKQLNAIQNKIYHFSRLYKNDPSYNLAFLLLIEGPLDCDRFLSIAEQITASAAVTRSRIITEDNCHFLIPDEDCADTGHVIHENRFHLTPTQFLKKLRSLSETKLNTAIDVTKPLRLSLELYSNSADFHGLIIHFSHIIADAYSFYHLISLLQEFYNSAMSADAIAERLRKDPLGKFMTTETAPIVKPHSKDFFQKEIGNLETLEMPKIKQRRKQGVIEGTGCTFPLDARTSDSIREFIITHETTEFSFFLAVYVLLLSRLTEQNTVVLGLPMANRTPADIHVFGCYVNTLPLKITLDKDMPFAQLCRQVFAQTLAVGRHQGFDMSTLDDGQHGYVNNVFTYYKQELAFRIKDCTVTRVPLKNKYLMFDFLGRVESAERFTVNLEYGKSLEDVDFETIYAAVIAQALTNKKLGDITLYRDLAEEYSSSHTLRSLHEPADPGSSLLRSLENIATRYPDRIAVKFRDETWSYKKLFAVSDNMARAITERFPDAGRIAVSCQRTPELIACLLGIIKSGKSYVPIDPNSPSRRTEYILADAGHIPLVRDSELAIWGSELAIQDSEPAISMSQATPAANPEPRTPDSELYVIYTSGSTGEPKGVPVRDGNLMSLIASSQQVFDFHEQDIWTLFHSYGFDFSVWEIFGCLLSGGKLVIVDTMTAKSSDQFYRLVSREKVTVLNQTPTAFKGFLDADSKLQLPLSLRYVVFGGEKLPFSMLTDWVNRTPALINMYGITEITIHATFYKITPDDILRNTQSIIGKPLSHLEIYIADQELNILPKGLPGEILVCGGGVVQGYHNKDTITRQKFVRIPAIDKIAYRSGDIGRVTPTGDLEYIGRMDNQIQLRGFRVELGEIETALMREYQDHQIRLCSVQFMEYNGHDQLVAFVVSGHPLPHKRDISLRLKSVLPDYMIPAVFIQIDEMPTTVNGKIDLTELKRKLPDADDPCRQGLSPAQPVNGGDKGDGGKRKDGSRDMKPAVITTSQALASQALASQASPAPDLFADEIERYVFDIISQSLNSRDFALDDNFFDIGVTSLHVRDI
ncbi:MAG: amino acid adenylation domain-containing protein, partial [Gracilibacteraceae bacterium]|nr:amino acid adenylation domain-containing protein [Gracilibacteraceae bacterium]